MLSTLSDMIHQKKIKKNGHVCPYLWIAPKLLFSVFLLASLVLNLYSCKGEKPNQVEEETEAKETRISTEMTNKKDQKVILFYGNSLTAGYGLDEEESFPSLIEDHIDSLKFPFQVINAGLSGETTSGGLQRIDWVLKSPVDYFILELGANDMLRGLPLDETRKNLIKIIEKVKAKNPNTKIGICEMMAPPNMGADYAKEFRSIYSEIAVSEKVTMIPFFLEGVVGHPDLILPDGKHPNAEGQKVVAKHIWKALEPMLLLNSNATE